MNTSNLLKAASVGLLALGWFQTAALGEWRREDNSLAWVSGTNVFWRFSFDPGKGKPYFHPLAPGGNMPLTNFKPADHPWHYALWFSWKYMGHPNDARQVNYWEENSAGNAQGKTRWDPPMIETQPDGRAVIRLKLSYVNPSGETDLTELRELHVSAPAADGGFTIDWRARFTAGDQNLVLDRTPMPGEPGGQVNGGYAGLSARMVPLPVTMSVVTTAGPVERFVRNRARPQAAAVACNFSDGARDIGSLAFFSDPANAGGDAPWYIIDSRQMPFICQALLAPKPWSVPAHGEFALRYRISVSPKAWTQAGLEASHKEWLKNNEARTPALAKPVPTIMPQSQYVMARIGHITKRDGRTYIQVEDRCRDGLLGLGQWSHIWVFYWFDQNDTPQKRSILQVHPRGNPSHPLTGVFATRSPMRPNLIALSLCRVISVKENRVEIEAIDAFDQTPVIDIKPYIKDSDSPREKLHTPEWIAPKDTARPSQP